MMMKNLLKIVSAAVCLALASAVVPQAGPVDSTLNGTGKLVMRGKADRYDINKVRLILSGNGRAEIQVLSGTPLVLAGTWTSGEANICNLKLTRFGSNNASGSGKIQLAGQGSFSALSITGITHSAQFELTFKASSGD